MEFAYDPDELLNKDRDAQLETMEVWFRSMYEDPAERTPYESREGGYIWIWGGPYDAACQLRAEFEGIVSDDIIEELADRLSGECPGWAPTERLGDSDEGLYEAISSNVAARKSLDSAVGTIRSLLAVQVPDELATPYNRLLFANVIAALETYLSDTFINRVLGSRDLLQKYIDSESKFRERKVAYRNILREANRFEQEAKSELLDLVWHNVGKVKPMYAQVLEVDLGDVSAIAAAIQTRHDIVHRNGRTKDGSPIEVTPKQILALMVEITELAVRVEIKLDIGVNDFLFYDDQSDF